MKVSELIQDFTDKKICNNRINENAVNEYLTKMLEIKTYIPFIEKRMIVETVVRNNITKKNGIKKIDSINQYISFVTAMLIAHTTLEIVNPMEDYDLLVENHLLPQIIAMFQESYNECQMLLNLYIQDELEDNSVSALVGELVSNISNTLDNVSKKLENLDMKKILGANFNEEDLAKLNSFLNKFVK